MGSNESIELLGVGLLSRLGKHLIAIPFELAGHVVEVRVKAIPLMRNTIRGVAFREGEGLVVLRLAPSAKAARETVVAIEIELGGLPVRCAIEVDGLAGVARLRRAPAREGAPAWWIDSIAEDGRAVIWIDIASLLRGAFAARKERTAPVAA
jgi:hypothetical protein